METIEKKWYYKTGWVIAFSILIFPLGLYLLWKNPFMSKITKWIIFGCWLALFGYSAVITDYNKIGQGGSGGENYEWDQRCCCEWKDPTFGYTKTITSVYDCKNFGGTYTTDTTKCY